MHRVHKPDWRFWLRAVNALALILVAFAHAPIDLRAGAAMAAIEPETMQASQGA